MAVRVLSSPAGQGEGSFTPPWSPGEWPRVRAGVEAALRHLSSGDEVLDPVDPRQVGEALFRALFSGNVGTLWARSLGAVSDRGLRLQLRLKLETQDSGFPFLDSFPWELLYQPDTRDFLALSRVTPVVRSLEVPRPVMPLRLPLVLRILGVMAEPASLDALNLARERREIEKALGEGSEVEIVFLKEARPEALRRALLEEEFHVLHFMGHGALDRSTGQGVLFFDRDGTADPVPGESLATLLKDVKSLRLVFLNACETAHAPAEDGRDPFAGVASALVMGGLPAVIAMQVPISDPAAIAFSRTVYLRLADGDPVDAAVTEGRLAIYTAAPGTMEWAIPVLFTRVADGRIFQRRSARPQDTVTRPVAVPVQRPSWMKALRSRRGAVLGMGLLVFLLALAAWLGSSRLPWPARKPKLARVRVGSIRIARYEVTQRDYLQFVLANPEWRLGRVPRDLQDGDYLKGWISWREFPSELAEHPVTRVSWFAAKAFCAWVGGRLPARAEWQMAAHTSEHRYPWGKVSGPAGPVRLNFCDQDCARDDRDPSLRDGFSETAPVTAFPAGATSEGALNLSGNVWEWCDDASGAERATLGGSYRATFEECSTDKASWDPAVLAAADGGFRCVWDEDGEK